MRIFSIDDDGYDMVECGAASQLALDLTDKLLYENG